ncbi:hypothetical protein [Anabaena sphaerica]|uniref:hypothetical protein n=1 Tax=Anabaena sphaerica TaxID=212446 RepID=UPI001F54992E|nr:hypothetical protein [Anabaena sphaerica]
MSVANSLENLRNIDTLKKLFCSQLNYERVNQTLSPRQLNETVINELAEEPLLLASARINNDFHIIYSRLKSENLSRQSERKVVDELTKKHPYTLFVFSNQSQSRWHFLNVKYDNTLQKTLRLCFLATLRETKNNLKLKEVKNICVHLR